MNNNITNSCGININKQTAISINCPRLHGVKDDIGCTEKRAQDSYELPSSAFYPAHYIGLRSTHGPSAMRTQLTILPHSKEVEEATFMKFIFASTLLWTHRKWSISFVPQLRIPQHTVIQYIQTTRDIVLTWDESWMRRHFSNKFCVENFDSSCCLHPIIADCNHTTNFQILGSFFSIGS
jgi:hypothetical protein